MCDDECVITAVSREVIGIVATIAADVIPVCMPLSAKLTNLLNISSCLHQLWLVLTKELSFASAGREQGIYFSLH